MSDIEEAKDKVMMEQKKIYGDVGGWEKLTVYHEGGHAIVALNEKLQILFIKQQ